MEHQKTQKPNQIKILICQTQTIHNQATKTNIQQIETEAIKKHSKRVKFQSPISQPHK